MSKRQPEIRIVYPEASAAAMLLTEAMIKRSTGKRVVETNSAEKEYTGEQLFGGMLDCSTDTSVELTLRLNPDAMDYALAMLIAKNLTKEERTAIRMETDSMEVVNLLSPAQAAEAPGQALDGSSSPDVPSAEREAATQSAEQEKQIDRDLTKQIAAALNIASLKLVTAEELKQLENFASSLNAILIDDDKEMQDTYIRIGDLRKELIHARYFGGADANERYIELQKEINPNTGIPWSEYEAYELRDDKMAPPPHEKIAAAAQEREKLKKPKKAGRKKQEPSWDDVEAEAQSLGKDKAEAEQEGDINLGLLNDLEDEGGKK